MPSPRIIYILGVDGSGKSTICRELVRALNDQGIKARYLWMRFNHILSKVVNALGHVCGLAFYVTYPDGTRVGYHHYHKSRLLGLAYSVSTIIDTFIASMVKLWVPMLINREVFVLDRFVFDVMVDLSVDTHNPELMEAWQGRMLKRLLPPETLTVYLAVDKEVIARRRPDTRWDETFGTRNRLYEKVLGLFPGILKIDNNGDMGTTLKTILGAITK
jgi:thymidylate kinase